MIYIILSALITSALVWGSFKIDTGYGVKNNNPLINIVLFLASLFALNTIYILLAMYAPNQFGVIVAKLLIMFTGWYSVHLVMYMLSAPDYDTGKAGTVIQWTLNVLVAYFILLNPDCVSDIYFNTDEGLVIESQQMFSGKIGEFLPVTVFGFYSIFFYAIIPLFVTLMVLVRSENRDSRLDRQRMRLMCTGILAFWIVGGIIQLGAKVQPVINAFSLLAFAAAAVIFVRSATMASVGDVSTVARRVLRFCFRFVIPALITGILFAVMWPMFEEKPVNFIVLYVIIIAVILTIWYQARKYFNRFNMFRDEFYAKTFEDQLAALNYERDTKEITSELFNIFKTNLSTSSLQILIDNGENQVETLYSSNDLHLKYSLTNPYFEVMLNMNHPVIFRDFVEHNYNFAVVKNEVLEMMDDADADAIIFLNEGRRVIGLILLGRKSTDNTYSDYDYQIFTKLYSYFFVVGYYMKNIVNESVVGTVNREIKMSGQIITSIQENMDFIKNKKVDAGYIMVPAHNIGGEFIDLIRLSDTRHIFVIGALNGKGIAASMNMVILKSVIRTFLAETNDFKLLVEKINSFIRNSLQKGTYFAGIFGLIDFNTDTLYYINCGAPALLLYTRAYNNVIEIQGEGRILGFAKDIGNLIKVKSVKLAAGDMILTCTDGLIETRSLRGEIFGKDRVQNCLTENLTYPANKMAQFEYDSLVQFSSKELEDDITVFVMKYLGGK